MSTQKVVDSVEVPGYEGRAIDAPQGSTVRVTNVEGCQIADFFALAKTDVDEVLSPSATRNKNFRMFPAVGEPFVSNRKRPMLTLLDDNSPGMHDMLFAPCDATFYQDFGIADPHPSCHDNYLSATKAYGLQSENVPDPVNLFQSTYPEPGGGFALKVSPAKPGDYVDMRAEMDLVVVVTACSVDITMEGVSPIGGKSTPLKIEILE